MDDFIHLLKEKNVYLLFAHGSVSYDITKMTYNKTVVPDDKTLVQFTLPGEYAVLTPHLTYYLTKNYHARNHSLLPLLTVYDSTDLYKKAKTIYWYINDLHEKPGIFLNFEETTPRNILKGRKLGTFTGNQSIFEHFYRSLGGSTVPDMEFTTHDRHPEFEHFFGLYKYNDKNVEKISFPDEKVYLHQIFDLMEPNSILFTLSCSAWKGHFIRRYDFESFVSNFPLAPSNLDDNLRKAIRDADSQVQENELVYKSQELLSSKSSKGWTVFNSEFPIVYIPILSLLIDPSRNYEHASCRNYYKSSDTLFRTAGTNCDAISRKNFINANLGYTLKRGSKRNRKTLRKNYGKN